MADDPYLRRGLELEKTGSSPPAPTPTAPASAPAAPDPYVQRGIELEAAPPLQVATMDPGATPQFSPDWTWGGVARQVGGALMRAPGNVADVMSDPYANLVGRPLLTAGQTAYDFVSPLLGGKRLTPEQRNALYEDFANQPGKRAVETISQAGGVDPYNVPGTPTEKFAGNVTEGALTAATLSPLFGRGWTGKPDPAPLWRFPAPGSVTFNPSTPALPGLVPAAVGGGTAAVGSQIASENAPDWAKPGAEMVGSVAGAKAGNIATNVGTRTVGAATGAKTPVAAAYDELGIDRRLVGDLSGDPTLRTIQAYGSKAPFGSSVVGPVEQKVVGQFGQAVEDTAKRLGTSTSEQTAGEVLQSEARNWRDVIFPQRQAQAWAPVDRMLGNERVEPSNYRTALTSLTSKLAGLPETQRALVPGKVWSLLEGIDKDVPTGQTMPWQDAQALRSAIGQVMGVPEIVQSVGKDQLKRAYGGISQDMQDTARAVDVRNNAAAAAAGTAPPGSAVDAFTNANKVSTDGHAFIEGPLSRVIRSNNPAQETIAPEKAASSVLGSGDTTLEALRRELPKAVDELAAYKLRDMGTATPGNAGATGQGTSVATFLTELNRLRQQQPAGFKALYADPEVARKIDAMSTVADTMKETAKRANTSGTGPYLALGEAGSAAVGMWLATHDPFYTGAAVAAPFAANRAAALVATNPLLARLASAPGPRNVPNPLLTGVVIGGQQQQQRNALGPP